MKRTIFITITLLQIFSTSIIFSDENKFKNTLNLWIARSLEDVKRFIAEGNDINLQNGDGNTLLHGVIDFETAQLLILHGADVNAQNIVGNTPLHFATDPKIVELLILHGADVNAQNKYGRTPLHTLLNNKAKTELLISHGAQIDITDNHNYTPLDIVNNPDSEIALIFAGARPSKSEHVLQNPLVQKAMTYVAAFKNLKTAKNIYEKTTPKYQKLHNIFENYLNNVDPESLERILLNSRKKNPMKKLFTSDFIKKVQKNKNKDKDSAVYG